MYMSEAETPKGPKPTCKPPSFDARLRTTLWNLWLIIRNQWRLWFGSPWFIEIKATADDHNWTRVAGPFRTFDWAWYNAEKFYCTAGFWRLKNRYTNTTVVPLQKKRRIARKAQEKVK